MVNSLSPHITHCAEHFFSVLVNPGVLKTWCISNELKQNWPLFLTWKNKDIRHTHNSEMEWTRPCNPTPLIERKYRLNSMWKNWSLKIFESIFLLHTDECVLLILKTVFTLYLYKSKILYVWGDFFHFLVNSPSYP